MDKLWEAHQADLKRSEVQILDIQSPLCHNHGSISASRAMARLPATALEPAMATVVTIYDHEGQPHKKSLPNARDMVNNAGWTWKPGRKHLPTQGAPYAGMSKDTDTKKKIQGILNGARDAATAQAASEVFESIPEAPEIEIEEVPDHLVNSAPAPVADDEPTEAEVEADASDAEGGDETAAKPRRSRKPKAE